jgi:ATP-binding protein involved in chromosome partitioning
MRDRLLSALSVLKAPGGGDIVGAGLVDDVQVRDGLVQLVLRADRSWLKEMEALARSAEALLKRQPGVLNASVILTSHRPDKAAGAEPAAKPEPPAAGGEKFLTQVKHVIAVASGKGGVGKSTVAVNMAAALAGMGLRTGLIDADIYGPSLPRMIGVSRKPEVVGSTMQPIEMFGMRCMSIGFLVPEDQAMVWRGPMIMGALTQMLGQTNWGPLDVMVVDLPPGTGDAQLTLSQKVAVSGAVIVSTPQDIALIDARRGVAMFEKVGVRVLGVVENMSYFACPHCGEVSTPFGHGGARHEAEKLRVPFLGEVPLLLDVRESGDAGRPIVLAAPESAGAQALRAIAARVWNEVTA